MKNLRLAQGMTQIELAEKIKLSKANVSKYEANLVQPNLDTLKLIADLFEVSVDFLLGKEEKEYNNGQNISNEVKELIEQSSDLTDEEIEKVRDYVELLKNARKK